MARSSSANSATSQASYSPITDGRDSGLSSRRSSGVVTKLPASVAAQQLAGGEGSSSSSAAAATGGKKAGAVGVASWAPKRTTGVAEVAEEDGEIEMADIKVEGKGRVGF